MIVRACVVRFITEVLGEEAGAKQAAAEGLNGFLWTPGLAALLAEYQRERARYAGFDEFMPRVVEFFDRTAEASVAATRAPK